MPQQQGASGDAAIASIPGVAVQSLQLEALRMRLKRLEAEMRTLAFSMEFGFLLDPLSVLMLCIVASISFLIQVYSLGYMAGDEGMAKYYSFLSLFAWSMISMVVAMTTLMM